MIFDYGRKTKEQMEWAEIWERDVLSMWDVCVACLVRRRLYGDDSLCHQCQARKDELAREQERKKHDFMWTRPR